MRLGRLWRMTKQIFRPRLLVALGYSKPFDAQFERISGAVLRKAEILSQRLGARVAC
jgi:hypothetical protein